MAWLFLSGAWLLGVGLVRRALGRRLSHAEQSLWGLVAGWMLSTVCAYLLARLVGHLSPAPLHALNGAMWAAALLLWLPVLKRIRRDTLRPRTLWRTEYAGLALTLALFAPIYLRLFPSRMLEAGQEGVYSGGSTWYDIGFHLAISSSFLYGRNFPPVYTPFPPAPLLYPFMPDFQTALLVALGMDFRSALISTAVPLALATTGLFYSLARRILHAQAEERAATASVQSQLSTSQSATRIEIESQTSATLATILFLLNGGLGFVYFFDDWRRSQKSFRVFWSQLETNYASMSGQKIHWTNIVVDAFIPQRAALYGFPVAIMLFTLFASLWQRQSDGEARGVWDNWRTLLACGALAGLLPFFHTHSFAAVMLVSVLFFLLRPRRVWLAFWTTAALVALPHFMSLAGHVAGEGFMRVQPGRRGHSEANWLLYWLRNIGLPLLLILPAWLAASRSLRLFYLPFAGLMLFSLLVVLTPNDYDNIKLMFYWYGLTSILVASWLVRLAHVHRQRLIAFLLTLASIASGLLALQYENLNRRLLYSNEEMAAARFVGERTSPDALFLTASTIHQPVLSLAGRAILRGDTAWLWSHGYDFPAREADIKAIYAGGDDALELLRYYRIDYIYLGQREREMLKADQSFFDQNFPLFYRDAHLSIYDARQNRVAPGESPSAPADESRASRLKLEDFPPREFALRLDREPAQLLVEFPRAAFAVYRFYRVAYGRVPRYREFMEDMRALGRGLYVKAPGWQDVLENNKRALTDAWPERDEFKSMHESKAHAEYVDALYANARVTPSPRERAAHVAALDKGIETRASILRRIAESRPLYKNEYNAAYVLMHYFGYLRRNPDDPPDKNLDGFNFWLTDLNRTRDYRSVTRVFIESGEYKDRQK